MNIHVKVTFKGNRKPLITYWDANEITLSQVNSMIGNSMDVESVEIIGYKKG